LIDKRCVMTTDELFTEISTITKNNFQFFQSSIKKLKDNQLNWKPNSQSWSIVEVLAHLNQYASYYHTVFNSKIENTKFKEPKAQFISSPLGKSAWKSMKLGGANNVKRKFQSPKLYNPTLHPELVNHDANLNFEKHQLELIDIIEKAKTVNIQRVKIPISISKFIRLKLGDALLFVVYHNERHIQQIKNLIEHRAFPTN
jgi:hypothetical protein